VRDGSTKIVRDLEGHVVAYDVTGQERRTDLPSSGSRLLLALDNFRLMTDRIVSPRSVGPLSPEQLERLRALGYVR